MPLVLIILPLSPRTGLDIDGLANYRCPPATVRGLSGGISSDGHALRMGQQPPAEAARRRRQGGPRLWLRPLLLPRLHAGILVLVTPCAVWVHRAPM